MEIINGISVFISFKFALKRLPENFVEFYTIVTEEFISSKANLPRYVDCAPRNAN